MKYNNIKILKRLYILQKKNFFLFFFYFKTRKMRKDNDVSSIPN